MNKMSSFRYFSFMLITLTLIPAILYAGLADDKKAQDMLIYYLDLVQSGNYESALGMWEPTALERATRLGIEYRNIPIKPDCGSPIIRNLGQIKDNLLTGIKSNATLDSGVIRIKFAVETSGGLIEHLYYMEKFGSDFWLIFPQDFFARDWPTRESKYFRFHINPNKTDYYNDIGAASLDAFVEKIANKIDIPAERMTTLESAKIDYYLCLDKLDVDRLSGEHISGYYDKGADAIISEVFPDFHLIARLLTNFTLKQLPYFTLPAFEEGLSIYLGGRWQRAPEVILDFGEYILDYKLTEIDSILTTSAAENGAASDITFPIDACLIDYLYSSLETAKFFDLYRALSGDRKIADIMTMEEIKTAMAAPFKMSWPEFKTGFEEYISSRTSHGGRIFPGKVATDREIINEKGLIISVSDKWLMVSYSATSGQSQEASLLFDQPERLKDKKSDLFDEQYGETEIYTGYRFGIRLDMNEIGLYDYATNQLKAKYVYNFAPDPGYYDSTSNEINAYLDISLLDDILPGKSVYEIIK